MARWAGAYEQCDRLLTRLRKSDPQSLELVQLEYVLLRAPTSLDEVESGLWNCVQNDHPEAEAILETLTRVYIRDVNLRRAYASATELVKRAPNSARAHDWLGWVLERYESLEQAEIHFATAVKLNPRRTDARVRYAELLTRTNKLDAAVEQWESILAVSPGRLEAQLGLAKALVISGKQVDRARELLARILQEDPKNEFALTESGRLELEAGNLTAAEEYLKRAFAESPSSPEISFMVLSAVSRQPGRAVEAKKWLQIHEKARSDAESVRTLVLKINGSGDQYTAANLTEVGRHLTLMGRADHAVYWFTRALSVDATYVPAHEAMQKHFEQVGDAERASLHRKELARLRPNSGE